MLPQEISVIAAVGRRSEARADLPSARRLFSYRQGTPLPNNVHPDAIGGGSVIASSGRCRLDRLDVWAGARRFVAAGYDDAIDDVGAATELQASSFQRQSAPAWRAAELARGHARQREKPRQQRP